MLKLKGPIQLKTGLRMTAASESFYQRLTGNYGLMTARVAPKDLLFLLTAPPELPEDLGGTTSLNLSNSFTDVRNMTVDVVNNVVNRILLDGHASFTYQDQVYITSVLRKLGVTDVTRFMEEVRRLRDEQRLQQELIRTYQQETTRKALVALKREEGGSPPAGEKAAGEATQLRAGDRYYLHQEIYRRLETGAIYQEVNASHQDITSLGDTIAHNELRLSEQLRLSRSLQLAELKQSKLYGGGVTMHHYINRYEQGELLPPPADEAQVLEQAAQAALVSTVERVVTQSLERRTAWREPWLDLKQSLSQTAENTLNRFEYYHSGQTDYHYQTSAGYDVWYQKLMREELTALHQLTENWNSWEQVLHSHRELPGGEMPASFSAPAMEHPAEGEAPPAREPRPEPPEPRPGLTTRELTSLTRQILSHGVEKTKTLRPQGIERIETQLLERGETLREEAVHHSFRQAGETLRTVRTLERELTTLEQREGAQPPAEVFLAARSGPAVLRETLELLRRESERATTETLREWGQTPPEGAAMEYAALPEVPEETAPAAAPAAIPADQAGPALLERELREIDRQNRERLERIQATQRQQPREVVVKPADQRRTMADALRAIDQPEQVLRELIAAETPDKAKAVPPEVQQILRQADPVSRQIYEALIRYQNDPEAAAAEGVVRPGSVGALNAEAIRRETRAAALEHPAPPAEPPEQGALPPPEGRGVLTERLRELSQPPAPPRRRPGEWGKAPIVLKREDYSAMEELVERLEERRLQSAVQQTTREDVSHQNVTQLQVNDQSRQVVTRTAEDITELVNRTMARQMNTLTEKVYRQMERKLQTERSRRGRF